MADFVGPNLRLARQFHDLSLAELGARVDASKQYLSRIESGAEPVSGGLRAELADALQVLPEFFTRFDRRPIADEQCHFRRQLTTKLGLRQVARARGEMLKRLVEVLDDRVNLPTYRVAEADPQTPEQIEAAAERFRGLFGLGTGPLSNVTRTAENAGAVIVKLRGIAAEIDAVSFATQRPLIVLNDDGRSVCRARFGIAHELGHFALHIGVLTGDRLTESQANRFASALLMPRTTFAAECRRQALRGSRLNWSGLAELKLRWGVSKAAILFRGRQLEILTEDQMRSGFIHLKYYAGEARQEQEDAAMTPEEPEVLAEGLMLLREHFGMPQTVVARTMAVQAGLLQDLLQVSVPVPCPAGNVVPLRR